MLVGVVTECRPAGGGWEVGLLTEGTTITCRLPDRPASAGDSVIITALDSLYFGAGGEALDMRAVEAERVGSRLAREP